MSGGGTIIKVKTLCVSAKELRTLSESCNYTILDERNIIISRDDIISQKDCPWRL